MRVNNNPGAVPAVGAVLVRWALAAIPLCLCSVPSMAETRGYVISWFATATNVTDFKANCPDNRIDGQTDLISKLIASGYSNDQARAMVSYSKSEAAARLGGGRGGRGARGRRGATDTSVSGENESVYNYPDLTPDPDIETVSGRYAYGFDLGGKAAAKFEDPQTHQKIDNQLWRAVGCTESFRASPPMMPYPEELSWNTMTDSAPAWAIQISGKDLSKDGPVTITLDRALQHLERDATGAIAGDSTYVLDPSPRSHNVLSGEIKNGVLTIKPASVYLEAEMPYYFDIAIKDTHMRFVSQSDGKLVAYWGGYINWHDFAYMYTSRPANGADSIGIYHALKKMADFDPDPVTGENRYISTAYRMEAVPAFIAKEDGKIVAKPTPAGLGGVLQAPELNRTGYKNTF